MYRILFMLGLAATGYAFAYAPTKPWNIHPSGPPGMVWLPGGELTVGPDLGWSDEKLCRRVRVDGFWMDVTEVTNTQLGTTAEKMIA
jgi:formylglycine-generating enzyme required for sulfatase activity